MDPTSTKFKKILVISLGMAVIFLLMIKNSSSGPSNMGSGIAWVLALPFILFIMGVVAFISTNIFIKGNIVTRFSLSFAAIGITFLVILILTFTSGFISYIYYECFTYHPPNSQYVSDVYGRQIKVEKPKMIQFIEMIPFVRCKYF